MQTAESNFSNFVIKYLGEIKTEFENILACLSGAQMGLNQEKNWRSKILRHTPVNSSCGLHVTLFLLILFLLSDIRLLIQFYSIPSKPIPPVRLLVSLYEYSNPPSRHLYLDSSSSYLPIIPSFWFSSLVFGSLP